MIDTLPLLLDTDFPALQRQRLEILQVNLGYTCNQSCKHCHVNAGPKRKEQMSLQTIQQVIDYLHKFNIKTLDLTGGAPEMNPHFKYLVSEARAAGVHVIDRCNLTILNEPGYEDLAKFVAEQQLEVVASMPCYLEENVDRQRGDGVYLSSIKALKILNKLGYGQNDSALKLNLMFNPSGPALPPPQCALESDYKKQLFDNHGIVFNNLYSLTNMPIKRFGSTLLSHNQFDDYMALLKSSHQHTNLNTVMCSQLISVDWQGYVYDCDFNQMLELPLIINNRQKSHITELMSENIKDNPIIVADHCYGCTAGQGSSCGGALA